MRLSGLKLVTSFFLAAILSAPAWGATPALPGTLNYVEGQVSLENQTLNARSVGSVTLEPGQALTTQTGKAEVLLTPGVFFRLGEDSAATLVSPSLTNTEIAVTKGRALVEVDDLHKDNVLRVQHNGANTQLLKSGIYGFDADSGEVRVFQGEALVRDGDRQVKVKGGHQISVLNANATGKWKTTKFDKSRYKDSDLYRFSNLRSQYLAEANIDAANRYWPGGPGWFGPGWYWDPGFWGYTWLPGDGYFINPFGFGFFSPVFINYTPYHYGRYPHFGHFYGGRPFARSHQGFAQPGHMGQPDGFHGPSHAYAGASHFGVMGGGFHGSGLHSGGFSGGGGFHR